MILRKYLFHRVAIIGVGLMGGSLGLALRKLNLAKEIVGVVRPGAHPPKQQVADEYTTDIKKALHNAELVVLATPVNTIINSFSNINPHLRRGAIVIDLGSTKASIVNAASKDLTNYPFFVGCHPLVGSEKKGADFANADLFTGAVCILTPTDKTNFLAREKVKHLWTKLGSHVKFMTPLDHDAALAYVSHLPHVLAYALVNSISDQYLEHAPSSLKDTTRIASSSPQMWNDICIANSKQILKAIDEHVKSLSQIRKAITNRDEQTLISLFEAAKKKRDGFKTNGS